MHPVRSTLEAVRFALELIAVGAVAAWGLHVTTSPLRWVLAAAAAALVLVVWGRFVAPRSPARLADPARLAVELGVFTVAAAASGAVTGWFWGVGYLVIAVADALLLRVT